MNLRYYVLIASLFFSLQIFSQKGKNGALVVNAANTRINEFTSLTSNASAGSTILSVTASGLNTNGRFATTLAPGDLVMVIQMQGALIKLSPVPIWAPDSTYGNIYNYQTCGNYEFAQVKSVISGTQIELDCGLTYNYSSSGRTQVVRVPRYSALTINSGGVLTTDAWNGSIGGILVAEVDGNTTISGGGSINVNGLGFRGGVAAGNGGSGNSNFATISNNNGAAKGEGIGSDRITGTGHDTLGLYCKGAPGNGGGGGNANNCAGGGGGNGGNISNYNGYGIPTAGYTAIWNLEWPGRASVTSSGGGKGGYGTATTTTPNVNSVGPNNTAWGSFRRPNYGGFGGRPLDYSTGKIFMGGGGGAGHMSNGQSNGANACSGGNGGGIVYLLNYGTISGNGTINANGNNGNNAFGSPNFSYPSQGIDGAGGAGAGGTIILKSNGTISGITANAIGGNGGNQVKSGTSSSESQGPGGGGSGGYISGNGSVFTQNVTGGSNGTTNASNLSSTFPMNGATSGDVGTNNQIINPSFTLTTSANQTICANQSVSLTATSNNGSATIQWFNNAAGGNAISTGTTYVTTYTATGTYTVYAGSCPGIYRLPIIITVTPGASITVNSATICAGQSVVLTASGATTYTWNTGATTASISVSPTVATVYTVNGTQGSCSGVQTSTVNVNSSTVVNVANASICSGNSATLTASGATNYTWMPGGQTTTSIVVSPTINTTYTITGSTGACSGTTTANVNVSSTPTLTANSQTICAGQVATFTVSGASTYTWMPGNITGSTYTTSPSSSGTISILGANGSCTTQVTRSITVTPNPTVAVSNQTICSSQNAIITASGASTYSWSTGATTPSISVSPTTTTVYTVTGTSSSCSDIKTVTITVTSQPTVNVNNASICSGNSTILTASGATNYTWMPGGQTTSTISVSPSNTTTYTITGATGTCTNSTTSTVSVTPTPTLIASSSTICAGQTATLTVIGATNYTWTPGNTNGTTYTIAPSSNTVVTILGANGTCTTQTTLSVTIGSGISIAVNNATICTGQTATLTASGATSYTWSNNSNSSSISDNPSSTTVYTVSGNNGSCAGVSTATIFVNPVPTLTASASNICSGGTATLNVSGANTYTWSNGNSSSTQTVNPNATTVYTVTGTNTFGCNNIGITTVTVNVATTPTLSVNSTSVCNGQTVTLTASGATSYTWNTGENTSTINVSPTNTSTFSVIGDNSGCLSSAVTSTVIVDPTTLSTFTNAYNSCPNQSVTIQATGSNSTTTTYTWSNGSNAFSQTVSPSTTSTFTVIGTSLSGCPALSGTVTVNVNSISADFTGITTTTLTVGETLNLTDASTNANNISWQYCGGTSTSSVITIPLSDTGTCCIKLVATNTSCSDSITRCVTVIKEMTITIPNVFTPNGDGVNEVFKITSNGLKSLHCAIYDRWGLKLYEWDGVNGYWDGNTKTGPAPDGTYFYIITYSDYLDKTTTEKGFLNLFQK